MMRRANQARKVARASGDRGDRGAFRGHRRGSGAPLMKRSITLPRDVVFQADGHVLQRTATAGGESYNRSARIEEALRTFLTG